jgi:glycosyltransferase involved in cell wall biosynthesis
MTRQQPPLPTVALVYDRVNTSYGGAEHVLEALHEVFPKAPLFTSLYDPQATPWAKNFAVIPSPLLKHFSWLQQKHRWLAPLMPLIFESHDLSNFDIVISITSAEAKGVLTLPHQLHLCYLLTPTRYLYSHKTHHEKFFGPLAPIKWLGRHLLAYLTWWDQAAQARPDYYLPISQVVAMRAKTYYPQATVLPPLYPPVRVSAQLPVPSESLTDLCHRLTISFSLEENNYAVVVSRLVSYKQVDAAIEGCLLAKIPLVVVGSGPEGESLQQRYKNNLSIIFVGTQPDENLKNILLYSQVVIMPAEEDFGITALEALAHGKPVILHHQSGASEVVQVPNHGQTLSETTPQAIKKALRNIKSTHFDPLKLHKHVQQYNTAFFSNAFKKQVEILWRQ